jgi:hypothetical protein
MPILSRPTLNAVTLICISGVNRIESLLSLLKAASKINFAKIVFVTTKLPRVKIGKFSIEKPFDSKLNSIDSYSEYCIYKMGKHINTEFCLVVQADSGILFKDSWKDDFLNFDYIGAPWPIKMDAYIDPFGHHQRVGNGGFSLRSKKLLNVPNQIEIPWNPNDSDFYRHMGANSFSEDGNICVHNRHLYEEMGCKFAPLEIALLFAKELPVPEYDGSNTFGYHKYK